MAVCSRLLSLFSLSFFAVFICSLQAGPVAALSVDHAARALSHPAHDALAKRKRSTNSTSKRCKPRPAPSSATSSSASSASSSPAPSPSSAQAPAPAPSSTAQHSSAAPAPSPSSSGTKNHKAGAGWANGEQWLDQWKDLLDTIYTWGPSCPSNAQSLGITCCPMLWGWNQVSQWQSEVMNSNPSCVMGPNEPEIPGQSNMDPGSAVALWNQNIRPMKAKGAMLISPATTSDPGGKKWMQQFFQICGGTCDADVFAVHYYDVSADGMIAFLNDLHATFHMQIWATEFACQNFNGGPQCSMSDVWNFQNKITNFMKSANFIDKYMPFGAMQNMQGVNPDNSLMNPNGGPNDLARAYFS